MFSFRKKDFAISKCFFENFSLNLVMSTLGGKSYTFLSSTLKFAEPWMENRRGRKILILAKTFFFYTKTHISVTTRSNFSKKASNEISKLVREDLIGEVFTCKHASKTGLSEVTKGGLFICLSNQYELLLSCLFVFFLGGSIKIPTNIKEVSFITFVVIFEW